MGINMTEQYLNMTDEELLLKLKSGEHEIIDYIMEKYKFLVRKNAKAMYLIGGESDDLLQEGMIGLFKAVRDFDNSKESSFYNFANVCISRQIYSAIKASNRKKHIPLNTYISLYSQEDEDDMKLIERFSCDNIANPEEQIINQESFDDFYEKLIGNLSSFEKKVLECYLDDMSYDKIAEVLGKNKKSIDNALGRIRKKMSLDNSSKLK